MKTTFHLSGKGLAGMIVLATLTTAATAQPAASDYQATTVAVPADAEWKLFSRQIVRALQSDHQGLQEGALRMIIQYGDLVDVKAARFDVIAIYRNSKDNNMRRMAVVALGKMHDRWALGFLRRCADTERCLAVRYTIATVLNDNGLATLVHPTSDSLAHK